MGGNAIISQWRCQITNKSQFILGLYKMQSIAPKNMSVFKKKSLGVKAQYQRMHLAVYPFEIEFLQDVSFITTFSFQKNYQIIGQIQSPIQPQTKHTKLPLTSLNNIINFRLYSINNVVYRWSVYKQNNEGQLSYLDACTLNLKQAVNQFIIPLKNQASHTPHSLIELGFIHKEMKLKFNKIGALLSFTLIVAEDPKRIHEYVERKHINKEQDLIAQSSSPHIAVLRTDSNKFQQNGQSSKRKKNGSGSGVKKNSDFLPKESSSSNQHKLLSNSIEKLKDSSSKIKQTPSDNLDKLILGFDASAQQGQSKNTLRLDSNNVKVPTESDLIFNSQSKPPQPPKLDQMVILNQQKKLLGDSGELRDYGVLKLQSDRVRQDAIDKKLELQQIIAIEQQQKERENTINAFPLDTTKSIKKSSKNSQPIIKQKTFEQTQIKQPQKTNLKKIGITFLIGILLFFIAGVILKQQRKKRKGGRKK